MADVKKFSTPKRRLVFERHSLDENKNRHEKCIKDHYLNHSVSMVIPNYSSKKATKQFQYNTPVHDEFCIAALPVHAFIEKGFIDKFIKQGHLYSVSTKTHIDTGNCVALLPTGVLILSLVKDTYEELGLTGKHSIFQKKMRFIVEIDLKSSSFCPGKSNYDRVSWCLKKSTEMEFEFILSWCDKAGKTNAEALQSHFGCYDCQRVRNTEDILEFNKLTTPVLDPDVTRVSDDNASDVCSFYEWLGCLHCDIDCSTGAPDSYTSTLSCPKPCVVNEKFVKCQWTGFITPQRILNLLENARIVLQSSTNPPPWVSINVWGFSDSPVTWLSNEHGFQYSGENMYTFVVFPDNQYWFFAALGSHDICS